MLIRDMTWFQVEAYLKEDDRAVLPIGSTEQHGYLSLCVDDILPERVACEAAEPLGVPVFPTVNYGITPSFQAFPGTLSLRLETMLAVVRDLLDGLRHQGFRRILIVNGHGGNAPVQALVSQWVADHPGIRVRCHDWWNAPKTWAKVVEIDPVAGHASWLEDFPWTRIEGVTPPAAVKPMVALDRLRGRHPEEVRAMIGDGNFGGRYRRSDEEMLALWQVAVAETRALLETGWA